MSERSLRRAREREVQREESREQRLKRRRTRAAVSAGAVLGATVLFAPAAEAATFTVENTNDSGPGSLRDAIDDANSSYGADEVRFEVGVSGTIALTSGELQIGDEVQVLGPGASEITVSGGNSNRIFYANTGDEVPVLISGLTLADGDAQYGSGGAVYARGAELTVSDSVLSGNDAYDGGALAVYDGTLTVNSSTLSGNTADYDGGAVEVRRNYDDDGTLQIQGSSITGNFANGGDGGGVHLYSLYNPMLLESSDISGNYAASDGGGIALNRSWDGGALTIRETTISGNDAGEDGGGAAFGPGPYTYYGSYINDSVTVESSTISENNAGRDGGGAFLDQVQEPAAFVNSTISGNDSNENGGGVALARLYTQDGTLELTGSTVANNTADSDGDGSGAGGGLHRLYGGFLLENTIVADNLADDASNDLAESGGSPDDIELDFSLVEEDGGVSLNHLTPGSNKLGQDPNLEPLADNGGPTETHAITAASLAVVDQGKSFGLLGDQRGEDRPVDRSDIANGPGNAADIGAFELQGEGAGPDPDPEPDSPSDPSPKQDTSSNDLPADGPLELRLGGIWPQRLGPFVSVKASCPARACTADAVGTLVVRSGKSRKRRPAAARRFELQGATADILEGRSKTLKLGIGEHARKVVAKVLANGGKVFANIVVTATDDDGNTVTERRRVKLVK